MTPLSREYPKTVYLILTQDSKVNFLARNAESMLLQINRSIKYTSS